MAGSIDFTSEPAIEALKLMKEIMALSHPDILLAGASDIANAFELKESGTRDGLEWLEALPRERDTGFERIRLGLGVAGVEAMELVDPFGQTTLLRFSNFARNPKLESGAFKFEPPKGADVLGE